MKFVTLNESRKGEDGEWYYASVIVNIASIRYIQDHRAGSGKHTYVSFINGTNFMFVKESFREIEALIAK